MDDIDLQIVDVLGNNSRTTMSEISRKVNLSIPATSDRIKKLGEAGFIEQFTIRTNRIKRGYSISAFVLVALNNPDYVPEITSVISSRNEVLECHSIAGEYDYLIKIVAQDTTKLEKFMLRLKAIKGVVKTNTLVSFSTIKEKTYI